MKVKKINLLHVSDLHFGKFYDRREFNLFNKIVSYALSHEVSAILISGDIFDGNIFDEKILSEVEKLFSLLTKNGVHIFAISGDSDFRNKALLSIARKFTNFHYSIKPKRYYFLNMLIDTFPYKTATSFKKMPDFFPKIVLLHGVFNSISASTLPYDYIALGHYHDFTKLLENAYYPGTPVFGLQHEKSSRFFILITISKRISVKKINMRSI